jgi:hypothetical protein
MSSDIGRRDLIKISAGAVAAAKLAAAVSHKFFTNEEYALVDDLSEMIIPTDDKSPGAKAAKVADFIDFTLAEAFEQEERDDFREGLKIFLETPPGEREALLSKAAQNEKHPQTPEEKFFRLLKEYTIRGYYTSKIGIHDDMDYKGNVYQRGEYAGQLPPSRPEPV